eukprot:TRINITY_DN33525_c0_g1_i1.p1 TRINITY_DN33525_c0_g1~~TRINITY_DN33525_c0_g1_i1.p1  ORF type:complete len:369 (+),score=69.17 TRINITY_DN33525_c0_g1_i1:33-1109(+)
MDGEWEGDHDIEDGFGATGGEEVDFSNFNSTAGSDFYGANRAGHIDRGRITNITRSETKLADRFLPKVQQMMVCFDMGITVQLDDVAARVRIFEFAPQRIITGTLHLPRPKGKVKITETGKCTIIGVKSYETAVAVAKKTCKLFRRIGYPAKVTNFRIVNIVGVTDLKVPIRLLDLHKKHHHWCTYEPEIFPALRLNMLNPKCTLSIFVNGKVVCIGARREASLNTAICRLFPIIRPFMGNADGSSEDLIQKVFGLDVGATKQLDSVKEEFDSDDDDNYEAPALVQNDLVSGPTNIKGIGQQGTEPPLKKVKLEQEQGITIKKEKEEALDAPVDDVTTQPFPIQETDDMEDDDDMGFE